jgi:GrpB-like predicted nucleotidyltransferase (UPF0157 family)
VPTSIATMDLDEPIQLVAYDPEWPRLAESEIQRVSLALGAQLASCEHFGSTSVPGCAAKPILDLLVGLPTWPAPPSVRATLRALGYEDCGEAGISGRLYFRRRGALAFNLAVTLHEGELWRSNVRLRELLRRDPAWMHAYVEAKRAAVRDGCTTLIAYSHHKAPFLAELARACLERSRRTP